MMVCSMKEMAGDLHAALLCCNQAVCTYLLCCLSLWKLSTNMYRSLERRAETHIFFLRCCSLVSDFEYMRLYTDRYVHGQLHSICSGNSEQMKLLENYTLKIILH